MSRRKRTWDWEIGGSGPNLQGRPVPDGEDLTYVRTVWCFLHECPLMKHEDQKMGDMVTNECIAASHPVYVYFTVDGDVVDWGYLSGNEGFDL